MATKKISRFLGIVAGLSSVSLWIVLIFFNPYSSTEAGPVSITFMMLLLPACLAIIAAIRFKWIEMLIAFLWSLPISAYVAMTPSLFAWFGFTSFMYFVSFLSMVLVWMKFEKKAVYSNSH